MRHTLHMTIFFIMSILQSSIRYLLKLHVTVHENDINQCWLVAIIFTDSKLTFPCWTLTAKDQKTVVWFLTSLIEVSVNESCFKIWHC